MYRFLGAGLGIPTLDSPEVVEESPVIEPSISERDDPAREGLFLRSLTRQWTPLIPTIFCH